MNWHVLSNDTGTILAVYGSALERMAREHGAEIATGSGCKVALHKIQGNRPSVYGSISMIGNKEWL
jgi:hypothetical protein